MKSANVKLQDEYREYFEVGDQPMPSSKDPSAHDIVNLDEKCGDESLEYYAFHLVPKETSCDDDVYLHENIPTAINMDSKENKDSVSCAHFQISELMENPLMIRRGYSW